MMPHGSSGAMRVKSQMYDLVIYRPHAIARISAGRQDSCRKPGEVTDWITGSARVAIVELDDMSCTTEALG